MYQFVIRVMMSNGTFQDLPFVAESYARARQQVESIYGPNSVAGCISEDRI